MKKRTVCLCLGTLAAVSLLWAADFHPDGTINVGQTFRPATGGEEISCLPAFDPNDPYYLELVEELHKARESGDRELAESIMKRIEEFTGAKWTHTKYEDMEKPIIVKAPEREMLTKEELKSLKGYEWENVKIYDADQNNAHYGDIGSASNCGGSGDTLYAVFDEWVDIMNVWGIRIFKSTDGGEHWHVGGGFATDGKDYKYPTIAVTKRGELLIAYFVDNDTGNDWVEVCKYTPSKGDFDFEIASDTTKNVYCPSDAYRPRIVTNYPFPFDYYIYVAYQTKEEDLYYLKIARSSDQNISYTYHLTMAYGSLKWRGWDLMFIDNDEASGDYLLFAYPLHTTEIQFKRSVDYGNSWSSEGLTDISAGDTVYYPTIGGVNKTDSLFCAWMMKTDGRWTVYGRYSGDRAESWSDTDIPVFVPDSGIVSKPVIQERTFGDKYYITAFYWVGLNFQQVLVGYADVMAPDVWKWDMIRDTSVYQVDCAPRIVTHNYGDGYKPAIVWSDGRDGTYDCYFGKRLPANDIASTYIYWPYWCKVNPETTATPYAKIKNVGEVDITDVPVVLEIINLLDHADFYIDTSFISLPIGDSADVIFDDWTAGVHPTSYYALVCALLDGDIEPGNDRVETWFTACNRELEDGWGTPTLDGILDTLGEWGEAGKIDISDTKGWFGPNAPLSCILYTLNDSDNLYLGIDYKADNSLEPGNKLIFQFDENHNGEWAPDSSEGWYQFYYPDSLFYQSLTPSPWTQINPPGFEVAPACIGGRVTYEIKLPLGTEKIDLTTTPGDVMGFFCAAYDKSESDFGGWYPQDWHPDAPDIFSPEYMADLKLASGIGVEEPRVQSPEFTLKILGSNPIGNKVSISFSIPDRTKVKLSVYDLSGRLVNRLADGVFTPGMHKVSWNPVLSNGVYFVRLENGTRTVTKKVVLLR